MIPKLIIMQGLPASGKSTAAKDYVDKHTDTVIVSRDALRLMRGKYWLPSQEKLITAWERNCIVQALINQLNVIVDATNLNCKHLKDLYNYVYDNAIPFRLELLLIPTDIKTCIERDSKRKELQVGEKVILRMSTKFVEAVSMGIDLVKEHPHNV